MLWIVIGVAAGLALLVLVARSLRFQEHSPSRPRDDGDAIRVNHVTTKRRIVLKGPDGKEREFESLDEVPLEFRHEIEEAMASGRGRTRVVLVKDGQRREYDSLDDVPEAEREHLRRLRTEHRAGVTIDVNGERHYFESAEDVPEELRKFVDSN